MTKEKDQGSKGISRFSGCWWFLHRFRLQHFSGLSVLAFGVVCPLSRSWRIQKAIWHPRSFLRIRKCLERITLKNNSNVRYEELNPYLVDALIATEDERYHDHSGIGFWSVVRVIGKFGQAGGGSTISQQLAKNLFRTRSSLKGGTVIKKFAEWLLAVRLENSTPRKRLLPLLQHLRLHLQCSGG